MSGGAAPSETGERGEAKQQRQQAAARRDISKFEPRMSDFKGHRTILASVAWTRLYIN
jgi:hypothetical protein